MSKLIVEVCQVEELAPVPNADRIERVRIKNWWCIAGKGQYKVGDKTVYLPPDSIIPQSLSDQWGITKYCSPIPKDYDANETPRVRIRACRFKGVASFGTIQNLDDPSWELGKDLKDHYGITKYDPPPKISDGDTESPHPYFHCYTSIENIGNYPNIFQDGEEVVILEKIHGCLHKNSPVTLYNNDVKLLHEIKIGDKIRSFDGLNYVEDKVVNVICRDKVENLNWYELIFDNGQKLICTECHLIKTNNGWISAKNLSEDDIIL